ncbi:MAG: hypothetical protein AB7I27_09245 [Bacteriovoracaceae bacterium]
MRDSQNNSTPPQGGGNNNNRRRRFRHHRDNRDNRPQGQPQGQGQGQGQNPQNSAPRPQNSQPRASSPENRNRQFQSNNRYRRSGGRVLTSNQVLVKYDNLLEQHLINRRKYYEYFNRVDDRQLAKLEKNFFDSIEHLRRFEAGLEPWQREALEKRKTERYRLDLTYSSNHGLDPAEAKVEIAPEEMEDPHFKDSQKEAFEEYKDDTEESEGTYEDYLKLKGL